MAEGKGGNGHGASRRDFLYVTAGGMGAVGTVALAWPFVDQMNPSKDVLALSSIEVDLSAIDVGQEIKVNWRGKPVFIRRRAENEIQEAADVAIDDLPDPQADSDRAPRPEWLILVGVCTHLGCIPIGRNEAGYRGQYQGWFCPCHGSHYDSSGRIRLGPAPANLEVPAYTFVSDTLVKIG